MKIYYKATQGDPTNGCYFTSNYHFKHTLSDLGYLTNTPNRADIIYITENCGGLQVFKDNPNKIKVLQLVCSHPDLYCKLLTEECEKWDMWDERPFMWAKTRKEEIELADYIIVYSEFSKQACLDAGVTEQKLKVIPKGVEIDIFKPQEIPRETRFTVLLPGQQFIIKGTQYAMKAYTELKREGFDFKFIMCGDKTNVINKQGNREFQMGRLIPETIENRGRVDRDTLIRLYNQCDVVLAPSIEDSMNMTVLEGLACDKPVICTKNTGASELIVHHKHGSIINIRNVKAIKREIRYWSNNKPKEGTCRNMIRCRSITKYMNDLIKYLESLGDKYDKSRTN